MAYQFQVDARTLGADVVLVSDVATNTNLRTVALTPPYGNCKVKVCGVALLQSSDDATEFFVEVIRNIDAEAVTVAKAFLLFPAVTAQGFFVLPFAGVDEVPDGRDVSYSVSVTMFSAAHNGQLGKGSYIEAALLSG